ncbi:hypothetical protein QAD02_012258 [Eretmocerus hayati]|uniref:Uncharacterized protein n=1 Tax=Eretmocerus hayati TaxID=131215 RepID=A0ACC2P090_9HYME|nr:hypothetical protein QAD02_012258 [Eretmocerus hayati]
MPLARRVAAATSLQPCTQPPRESLQNHVEELPFCERARPTLCVIKPFLGYLAAAWCQMRIKVGIRTLVELASFLEGWERASEKVWLGGYAMVWPMRWMDFLSVPVLWRGSSAALTIRFRDNTRPRGDPEMLASAIVDCIADDAAYKGYLAEMPHGIRL